MSMLSVVGRRTPLLLLLGPRRAHSTASVVNIPRADVYRFGQATNTTAPVFKNLEWIVNDGENWVVVGSGSDKANLLQMLTGQMRLAPPPPTGIYPFLTTRSPPLDPHEAVALVSFSSRLPSASGGFFDYTARYGAVREELRRTLRETLFSEIHYGNNKNQMAARLEDVANRLDLKGLLDLPFIVLSNGQTRRARIAKALLNKPELLLLDEPLTGLDTAHRAQLTNVLHDVHVSRNPRILMALRPQDPLPEWITHVARVEDGHLHAQPLTRLASTPFPALVGEDSKVKTRDQTRTRTQALLRDGKETGKELVKMQNVNVQYQSRHVLKDINWTIREGEKWHLQGPNGSGKTTLLSLLTGAHPQSYTQRPPLSSLTLFSKPRSRQPTVELQRLIGHVSPEVFAAFPRRGGQSGMSVREVVATGFDGIFCYRRTNAEESRRVDELLVKLSPQSLKLSPSQFGNTSFTSLPPSYQSLTLLLRALVSSPPLLILDEPFAGMDDEMVRAARRYLREDLPERTSVVFVSHWEEEVPWSKEEGVKRITIVDGEALIQF